MKTTNILTYICLGLSWVFAACTSDSPEPETPPAIDGLFLRLTVDQAGENDAVVKTPMGGETGDGSEIAFGNETKINCLDLVFYNSESVNAINDDATAKVINYMHLTEEMLRLYRRIADDGSSYYMLPLTDYVPAENDRILVYANSSEALPVVKDVTTLDGLRDLLPGSTSWSGETVRGATSFTMATARHDLKGDLGNGVKLEDGKIYTKSVSDFTSDVAGDEDDPFYVVATVERTSARIDFMYDASNIGENSAYFTYDVSGGSAVVAKVKITDIAPLNVMQKPSYWLKHVTESLDNEKIKYCDHETLTSGKPSNYVVEPTTFTSKNSTSWTLSEWYGATSSDVTSPDKLFTDKTSVTSLFTNGVTNPDSYQGDLGYGKYLVLSYANENVCVASASDKRILTGLAFRAFYKPKKVIATDKTYDDFTYPEGTTFYRYSPSIRDEQNGNDISEAKSLYFSTREGAESYRNSHSDDAATITEYKDGVCYYNLWLRHTNVEDGVYERPQPMEFAIVRNNIYRVGISFKGPGNPVFEIREPFNIHTRIYVRKWNEKVLPEIIV